jgi:hypothetical protein
MALGDNRKVYVMPDANGATLEPGDPVLLRDDEGGVAATIVREVGESRYLIQLDEPLRKSLHPFGPRKSLEVEGSRLVFMGDFDE